MEEYSMAKTLYIIAGANGSGKATIAIFTKGFES